MTQASNRDVQVADRVRIFFAAVDVALGGTDGQTSDGHALDQTHRVAFHQHTVTEGTGVAFVGVTDDVLLISLCAEHGVPLDAGREGGTATTTQAGVGDFLDDGRGLQREGLLQTVKTFVLDVVLNRVRVGDADARKGQAFLLLQVGDFFGQTERLRACLPPLVRPASNRPATSLAVTGP